MCCPFEGLMGKRELASVDSRGTTAIKDLRPGMRYGEKVSVPIAECLLQDTQCKERRVGMLNSIP